MAVYVLDSNFFIEAQNKTYPLDIAVTFWNKVKQLADAGIIISIDKVKNEIYHHDDDLKEWCIDNLPPYFFTNSTHVMNQYNRVATWANTMKNQYAPSALHSFLDAMRADAFLIAYSLADTNNRIIVTQEISAPLSKNSIKIPDACNAMNVKSINTIAMFRQIGETF